MIQLKKTILTLALLLTAVTGAWADGISVTTEDFGKVICTDGSIYATVEDATAASKTAAAKIFFIDNVNKKGLALALADESGTMDWSTAKTTAAAHTPAVTGGTWKLATMDEWTNMRKAAKNYQNDEHNGHSTFKNMANLTQRYWVNTEDEYDSNNAYYYIPYSGSQYGFSTESKTNNSSCYVRACLEFNIAAPSGPEVAWNKVSKTGTFTMPGGNVTLEPEYYPQAALTVAPTAINDVPATTDGAIVKAGTVANIGSSETAQGTVMYYVSQTALDDAALLALAADAWTADVPTAQSLAKGQAYVYYYVRGNDSDTDEENFSDGDIKSANALTVTIAAEPTYAVTFAEGTDPNEWTATPNTGLKQGDNVTVTYTGSKKVIGVKAEKKAKGNSVDLSTLTAAYEAQTLDILTGTTSQLITIAAGATVTLKDVTVNNQITCLGDATIILADGSTNTVTAPSGKAGIKIGDVATETLTIDAETEGTGTLTVQGGANCAGIGTNGDSAGGNIVINGGRVTATGGANAAGIGTGNADNLANECGSITINGGTVTAKGVNGGAGIGTGVANYGTNTCGAITINGGTVTATGGGSAAGIGTGYAFNTKNECGAITIDTGVTSVTATKGTSSPNSIGTGEEGDTQRCGTITIGGVVKAQSEFTGATYTYPPSN